MEIQTALEHLAGIGGPDGVKAVAFAQVDYLNEGELRAAHAIFGQVWYGITVLAANDDEYWAGEIWDFRPDSPVASGHSVTGVGYDPTDYRFITWAKETKWTEAYRTNLVEEAWVVIWPEHFGAAQFMQGINQSQLAADYQAITGRPLPTPPPTPYVRGPSVVAWASDRLDVFVRGTGSALWHQWWDGTKWGGFQNLGGTFVDEPAVCAWGADRLDAFVCGNDGAVWHQWWDGSRWGVWQSLGGHVAGSPAVVSWAPRRLDVVARGIDNAVWHQWWDGTRWGVWQSLGGPRRRFAGGRLVG
ncbi:MAG: hypothetical protein M3Z00_05150, partial [Actinomycetota bacterium]|nr:hypothetical protein [Actinomycetota bacterium]